MKTPLSLKSSIKLSLIGYYFYRSICLGYFIADQLFNFLDEVNEHDISKSIEVRKKFGLRNVQKTIINFLKKITKNWFLRLGRKSGLLIQGISKFIKALKISKRKFKSIFKFKRNFRILKTLLDILAENFFILCSLMNELFFVRHLISWMAQWLNFIQLLMNESVFVTRIIYFLYLILLGILGISIGFWLSVYEHYNEIPAFILCMILELLYFYDRSFKLCSPDLGLSIGFPPAESTSTFSLESAEIIKPNPPKFSFDEPAAKMPLPFLIFDDPSLVTTDVLIDTEIFWDQSTDYQFKLFKFSRNMNQKI